MTDDELRKYLDLDVWLPRNLPEQGRSSPPDRSRHPRPRRARSRSPSRSAQHA
jgi:hypothetical protein